MAKRYLVALGGNAILTDNPSAKAQQEALKITVNHLADLVEAGNELVITHGNGPQVGNLLLQQLEAVTEKNPAMPLDTVGAMTEGEIGYWMANAFDLELKRRQMAKKVAVLVTRTLVSAEDPSFQQPSKPIGPFYSQEESEEEKIKHEDWIFVEDAGRGYRRVVPSPKPLRILEAAGVNDLIAAGHLVIAAGGGGIPVIETDEGYQGVEAVIDKDFTAAKLAELVQADELIILTAVDNVFINFNQANQEKLKKVTVDQVEKYLLEGQFAAGSMKPKIEAAISFVRNSHKRAVITSLDNVVNFLKKDAGTIISL